MNLEEGMQFGDLAGMLRRRWQVVALITGGIFLVSIFIASVLPNEYSSYATILVEPQLISKRLVASGLEETDLNSRLNLMTAEILSRPRLSRIIDDLTLYAEQSEVMTREEIIMLMQSQIMVTPVIPELYIGRETDYRGRIDTFRIHHRSDNAKMARDVANRIANDFIEEHIRERVQVAGDTSEFIENELGRIATRMRELEEQRARIEEENAGVLPSDVQANQGLLSRAYDNMRSAQGQLSEAQSDRTFWEQQALISETSDARQEASPILRLAQLELSLAELKSKGYTEKHPSVVQVQGNIEGLRAQIATEGGGAETEEAKEKEPISLTAQQQGAQAQVSRAEQRIGSAEREVARLEAQISELEEKMTRTPQVTEALGAINREAANLETSYREYAKKRMEAGVAANMERRQKGEQFRVLESAFLPPKASSPNRPLIVALGLLLGFALGGGVAVLLEASDTSFHDSRKLQSMIRIPVLASIPAILLEADRRAQRRRRMRAAFAGLVVTGFVLSSSAVGYVYVNGAPGFLRNLTDGEEEQTPAATPPPAAAAAPPPAAPPPAAPADGK